MYPPTMISPDMFPPILGKSALELHTDVLLEKVERGWSWLLLVIMVLLDHTDVLDENVARGWSWLLLAIMVLLDHTDVLDENVARGPKRLDVPTRFIETVAAVFELH